MQMFPIKGILQEFHNVISYGVLGREAFRPSENLALIQRGLLHGETEGQSERKGRIRVRVDFIDC